MSTQGNGGIFSKFQERLRKIRLSRIRKKQKNKEETEKFVNGKVKEIKEVISKEPVYPRNRVIAEQPKIKDTSVSEVIEDIRATAKDRNYSRNKVGVPENDIKSVNKDIVISRANDKVIKDNNNLEEKRIEIKENKPKIIRSKRVGYVSSLKKDNISNISDKEKQDEINKLGSDIIEKLKISFEDKIDELEVLSSELYILGQQQNNELELNKVKEVKDRINELINKINDIIDQYNLYKKNYYIDNVIGIDDSIIVDDIINYRDLLDSFENEKEFVKEIKALEEFKSLYNDLKEIRDVTEMLQNENEEKIEEYGIRDKKYNNIKIEMVKTVDIGKNTEYEIEKQNKYFTELMSKVNHIEKQEYVTTHLRGVGNLIGQSLRFMGLMLVSPLTGLLPGIGMQTLAARRMVGNAYRSLHFEDVNHVSYSAIDYDSELNHHLNDVNYVEDLVDNALRDVDRLKEDFIRIYDSKIPGYEDTLKKIEKLEKKLMHNQNKVSIVKKNLKKSKKLNEDKMVKVRQLNDGQRAA